MQRRRSRLFLAIALASLLPWPALALRPRPLSDLRLESPDSPLVSFIATDGADFLIAGSHFAGLDVVVSVQKFAHGAPAGARTRLAAGNPAGVAWTGTHYLVAWFDPRGLWIAEFSREGTLLQMPAEPVLDGGQWFAWNGKSGLALAQRNDARLVAQPLDGNGRKSGNASTSTGTFGRIRRLDAAAEGFVADVEFYPNAQLLFLGADGAPRSVYSILGRSAVTATNGRETVVIYSRYGGAEVDELWSIVFAADGTIRRQPQRLGIARRSLYSARAIWDGSQYLVAIDSSPTAKLLRVSQAGDAIGDLIELNSEGAQGLAANGSDVLVLASGAGVLLRGATLDTPRAVNIWQGARTQAGVTITAGGDQYLAAWAERSGKNWMIRASRIDAEGNYLDGEGLLLGTMAIGLRFPPAIATASDGSDFIVVWGERATNAARVSSTGAVLDSPPLMIAANGEEFDVAWNGASYIVVYTVSIFDAGPRRGLYRASITREGSVSPPLLIADMRDEPIPDGSVSHLTYQLSLAILDGEGLVVFQQQRHTCRGQSGHHCFGGASTQSTVEGLRLDGNGGAAGRPFTIAAGVPAGPRWLSSTGGVAVASDGASYLVLWSQRNGVVGTLIPTGPQPPATSSLFGVAPSGYRPSLAFDGRDYVAAWESFSAEEIFTARLSRTGNVLRVLRWPAEEGERVTWAIIATNAKLPPLIAFTAPGFSGAVTRGGMLFESEFEPAGAPPRRPLLLGVARNDDDTVTVQWQRADDVLGVLIELQLVEGSYRTIGAVAPIASTARVPLAGLNGVGVRVRTWNSSGDSEPSATILFSTKRRAAR